MKRRVLVVGENKDFVEWIRQQLVEATDLLTVSADSRDAGLELALQLKPNAILIDTNREAGAEDTLCRRLRRNWETREIPLLLFLDADVSEEGKLIQKLGAEEYIYKPVLPEELFLKTEALVRRAPNNGLESEVFNDGHLVIDSDAYLVEVQGRRVKLTLKEFGLLSFLARNQGQVFSRDKLMDVVWERHSYPETRTVDVHVRRIRMKLGPKFEHYIQTIVGVGYLFDPNRLGLTASRAKEAPG